MQKSLLIFVFFLTCSTTGCMKIWQTHEVYPNAKPRAAQQKEAQAINAYDKARQLYHNKAYLDEETALQYLSEALSLNPTLTNALYDRAVILIDRGRYQDGLTDIETVLEYKPDHLGSLYAKGVALFHLGETTQAVSLFSKVLQRNNSFTEAYVLRGTCFFHMERYTDAIDDFTQALALNPAHIHAYHKRSLVYTQTGKDALALHDMTTAIALDSQNVALILTRGRFYLEQAHPQEAEEDFLRASTIDPTDDLIHAELALAQAANHNMTAARASLRRAIALAQTRKDQRMVQDHQKKYKMLFPKEPKKN